MLNYYNNQIVKILREEVVSNVRVKFVCGACGKEISYDIPGGNDVEKYKRAKGVVERKGCPFCKNKDTLRHISSDPVIG